mmetsp:Transcript_50851/g.143149  ORF Transcript_50851/g.143149 Transcript_50851/m.143149 type:complete len:227 (+) Transcript_50851:470-1150(+)
MKSRIDMATQGRSASVTRATVPSEVAVCISCLTARAWSRSLSHTSPTRRGPRKPFRASRSWGQAWIHVVGHSVSSQSKSINARRAFAGGCGGNSSRGDGSSGAGSGSAGSAGGGAAGETSGGSAAGSGCCGAVVGGDCGVRGHFASGGELPRQTIRFWFSDSIATQPLLGGTAASDASASVISMSLPARSSSSTTLCSGRCHTAGSRPSWERTSRPAFAGTLTTFQ